MNTPLLAADEPNTVPSLSSPDMTDPDANSQLTMMLREASSPPSNATFLGGVHNSTAAVAVRTRSGVSNVSWITVLTGSCSIITIALLWGSYLCTQWFEIRISTEISWLTPNKLDTSIRSTDLGTIIGTIAATNQHIMVGLLAITAVVVPCLTMIIQPWTIAQRHSSFMLKEAFQPRSFVDYFTRFGFLLIFVAMILDRVVGTIELNFSETKVLVYSEVKLGCIAFAVGITLSLFTAIVLRFSPIIKSPAVVAPEPVTPTDDGEDAQYMRVLEEESEREEVVERAGEQEADVSESPIGLSSRRSSSCSCSMALMVFESGLISTTFLIASFVMPLAQVRYEGVAADFMPDSKLTMHLGELSSLSSNRAGSLLIVCQVLAAPIITMILATCSWFQFTACRRWLFSWYPAVNGLTFGVALILTPPAIDSIVQYVLNEDTSAFCQQVHESTGQACLTVDATLEAGGWCYLVHAVSLEAFLLLTLWGTR